MALAEPTSLAAGGIIVVVFFVFLFVILFFGFNVDSRSSQTWCSAAWAVGSRGWLDGPYAPGGNVVISAGIIVVIIEV